MYFSTSQLKKRQKAQDELRKSIETKIKSDGTISTTMRKDYARMAPNYDDLAVQLANESNRERLENATPSTAVGSYSSRSFDPTAAFNRLKLKSSNFKDQFGVIAKDLFASKTPDEDLDEKLFNNIVIRDVWIGFMIASSNDYTLHSNVLNQLFKGDLTGIGLVLHTAKIAGFAKPLDNYVIDGPSNKVTLIRENAPTELQFAYDALLKVAIDEAWDPTWFEFKRGGVVEYPPTGVVIPPEKPEPIDGGELPDPIDDDDDEGGIDPDQQP